MALRKTKTTISEEQKKALMCVVHFQGSACKSFVYFFLVAKDLRIDWKSFTNRMEDSFNQMPEELKP